MNLAHYILQANIYLIVFYGFYRLLLDRETYFMLNRVYLISAACFSLLIPFIRLDWFSAQPLTQNVSVNVSQLYMVAGIGDNTGQTLTWGNSIALVYVIGVCLFLARFIIQLLSIKKLIRSVPKGTAFSFFNKLFIDHQLPQQDIISKHEQIHMRQLHSVDVIFFELIGVFTWFNPVIYLFKQSIKNIHEYLADEEAAKFQGSKEQYSLLLLSSAFGVNPSTLTNSFFNKSMIKKRITMLNKQKSRRTAIMKYGLFLPLFGLTLILSSATVRTNESIRVAAESIADLQAVPGYMALNQAVQTGNQAGDKTASTNQDKVYDFTSVDTPPSFPGGIKQFYSFIGRSIKYPKEAVKNNVQGKVFLAFIVEKDGRLSQIKVERPLGFGTDEEAIRVLKSSPRWKPGLKDKKPIRVLYRMPISFALSNSKGAKLDNVPKVNANPVYIIDGVKASAETVQRLDAKNIESVNVYKGAAAEKFDGPSNKDGVIVIKTRLAKTNTSAK
jgi:TonB family protein